MVDVTRCILPRVTDQYQAFCAWVEESCQPDTWMLDVGAGDGDNPYANRLRQRVLRLVGVDPDPGVATNPYLDERQQVTLERYVTSDPPPFDVAVAVYVLEHVREPDRFLGSVRSCLRPGGSLFIITPNLWHYFGVLARVSSALHLEERLLRVARADKPDIRDAAHFPVRYRLNSVRAIARHAEAQGFTRLEIRHLDNPGIFESYFPERLHALPRLYSSAAYRLGRDAFFGTLLAKLTA